MLKIKRDCWSQPPTMEYANAPFLPFEERGAYNLRVSAERYAQLCISACTGASESVLVFCSAYVDNST